MSDIFVNESQYESQYINTEQKVSLSSAGMTFAPLEDASHRESFTGVKYITIELKSNIVRPETKREIKPPVYVEGDSIMISSQQLELSRPYYVRLENRTYVVFMPEEGIVDLYALPE